MGRGHTLTINPTRSGSTDPSQTNRSTANRSVRRLATLVTTTCRQRALFGMSENMCSSKYAEGTEEHYGVLFKTQSKNGL